MPFTNLEAIPLPFYIRNKKNFNLVFNEYYSSLCFFAGKLVDNFMAAEDIVEDVFINLWERGYVFDNPNKAKAWLYIATKNACFNYIKKLQHKEREQRKILPEYSENEMIENITKAEAVRQIYVLIEELPLQCRKVVRLTIKGYSNQEIAELLNLSQSTVKNQKVRAIKLMRVKLIDQQLLAFTIFFAIFGD